MIGLASGKLMAFDVANGSTVWNWQTGGPILARPIPAIQLVAFASQDGKAYVALVDPATMLYRFAAGGPISASMGTFGTRTLLIPSEDKNLYAIDLFTAETKWTFPSGAPILQEPLVANNDVYVVNSQGQIERPGRRVRRASLDDLDPRGATARGGREADLPQALPTETCSSSTAPRARPSPTPARREIGAG